MSTQTKYRLAATFRSISTFIFGLLLAYKFGIDDIWFWVFSVVFLFHGSMTHFQAWNQAINKAVEILPGILREAGMRNL